MNLLFILSFLIITSTSSYTFPPPPPSPSSPPSSRRTFLSTSSSLALPFLLSSPSHASEPSIPVYFGAGCFWHVQHEFVVGEIQLLKRTELQLTSRAGYAGGTKVGKDGRVCYHNLGMKDEVRYYLLLRC